MPAADALTTAATCVLVQRGERWPAAVPTAFWSDGAALWAITPAATAAPLRDEPACTAWVPAPEPSADGEGVRVDGTARVFGPHDPVALVLHGATLSAVLAALAVKRAGAVVASARSRARGSFASLPVGWSIVKVAIERLRRGWLPRARGGIAPPLPPVVPAEVRRAVGGRRDVVVAVQGGDGLEVGPARLGSGWSLDSGMAWDPPAGPATVVVEAEAAEGTGVRLSGVLTEEGRLEARHAAWWRPGSSGEAAVAERRSGVVLPD